MSRFAAGRLVGNLEDSLPSSPQSMSYRKSLPSEGNGQCAGTENYSLPEPDARFPAYTCEMLL